MFCFYLFFMFYFIFYSIFISFHFLPKDLVLHHVLMLQAYIKEIGRKCAETIHTKGYQLIPLRKMLFCRIIYSCIQMYDCLFPNKRGCCFNSELCEFKPQHFITNDNLTMTTEWYRVVHNIIVGLFRGDYFTVTDPDKMELSFWLLRSTKFNKISGFAA